MSELFRGERWEFLRDVPRVSKALRDLAGVDAELSWSLDAPEPPTPNPRVRRLIKRELQAACAAIRRLGPPKVPGVLY